MKIAKAPTDEDHGYLFIYVGMEYIFSKAQEAEVEKQLREAGGKLSEHGALLLNRGLLLLKLCFNQGISKAGNKSLGMEISLVLKGRITQRMMITGGHS